jgi:hypothetical protein
MAFVYALRPLLLELQRQPREETTFRVLFPAVLMLGLTACSEERAVLEVDITTERLSPAEMQDWAAPAVQSGLPGITVRQMFTAQGPCRELEAALMPRYPGEYLLRVAAEDLSPCEDETRYIDYTALLRGLPPGSHRLRVVHFSADGRPLAEAVFEHPIIVIRRTDG